jgi:hypothetical protein
MNFIKFHQHHHQKQSIMRLSRRRADRIRRLPFPTTRLPLPTPHYRHGRLEAPLNSWMAFRCKFRIRISLFAFAFAFAFCICINQISTSHSSRSIPVASDYYISIQSYHSFHSNFNASPTFCKLSTTTSHRIRRRWLSCARLKLLHHIL